MDRTFPMTRDAGLGRLSAVTHRLGRAYDKTDKSTQENAASADKNKQHK